MQVRRAGCGQRRRADARPVPVTSPSPPVSRFKSAARGTVTVCTLSHNIPQFERRKGWTAGPAAPPGQRHGRQAGPSHITESESQVRAVTR
jgi:hypothetical protein